MTVSFLSLKISMRTSLKNLQQGRILGPNLDMLLEETLCLLLSKIRRKVNSQRPEVSLVPPLFTHDDEITQTEQDAQSDNFSNAVVGASSFVP